jgi:hypothetical protein
MKLKYIYIYVYICVSNFMEQDSSSEANMRSASQEISHF